MNFWPFRRADPSGAARMLACHRVESDRCKVRKVANELRRELGLPLVKGWP